MTKRTPESRSLAENALDFTQVFDGSHVELTREEQERVSTGFSDLLEVASQSHSAELEIAPHPVKIGYFTKTMPDGSALDGTVEVSVLDSAVESSVDHLRSSFIQLAAYAHLDDTTPRRTVSYQQNDIDRGVRRIDTVADGEQMIDEGFVLGTLLNNTEVIVDAFNNAWEAEATETLLGLNGQEVRFDEIVALRGLVLSMRTTEL